MEIILNLYIPLGSIDILIVLIIPIHKPYHLSNHGKYINKNEHLHYYSYNVVTPQFYGTHTPDYTHRHTCTL